MNPDTTRRRLLLTAGAWLLGRAARGPPPRLTPTPAQSAGPFYPTEPPPKDDHDLTHVRGGNGIARGRITDLSGRLLDSMAGRSRPRASKSGRPMPTGTITTPWIRATNGIQTFRASATRSPTPMAATAFAPYGRCLIPAAPRTFTSRCFPEGSAASLPSSTSAHAARNAADFLFGRIPPDRLGDGACRLSSRAARRRRAGSEL